MTDRPLQDDGDEYTPPEGWAGSQKGGGLYEWVRPKQARMQDIYVLRAWQAPNSPHESVPDMGTICGTYSAAWRSQYWGENKDKAQYYRDCPGGIGTATYEYQEVGGPYNGVIFAKEPIWHVNADGNRVMEIPGNAGEYHEKYLGDGHTENYVGPEPESVASFVLGGGEYFWDFGRVLYSIAR